MAANPNSRVKTATLTIWSMEYNAVTRAPDSYESDERGNLPVYFRGL